MKSILNKIAKDVKILFNEQLYTKYNLTFPSICNHFHSSINIKSVDIVFIDIDYQIELKNNLHNFISFSEYIISKNPEVIIVIGQPGEVVDDTIAKSIADSIEKSKILSKSDFVFSLGIISPDLFYNKFGVCNIENSYYGIYQYYKLDNGYSTAMHCIDTWGDKSTFKSKKIICSTRRGKIERDWFFYEMKNKYPHLMNNDNIINYHRLGDINEPVFYPKNGIKLGKIVTTGSMFYQPNNFESGSDNLWKLITLMNHLISYTSFEFETDCDRINKYATQRITEKIQHSMSMKTMFFPIASIGFEKNLRSCGIETFSDLFDCNYDHLNWIDPEIENDGVINKLVYPSNRENIGNKYLIILRLMNKINNMSFDTIKEIYNSQEVQRRLDHNYNLIKNCVDDHQNTLYIEYIKNAWTKYLT